MVEPTKLPSLDSLQETKSPGSSTMDLGNFVIEAKRIDDQEFEEQPKDRYFPTKLWRFTRSLKGHSDLEDLEAEEALEQVCDVLSSRFPGQDPLSDVLGLTREEELQFITTWDKVRHPSNWALLNDALELAKQCPLVPEYCKKRTIEDYELFIGFAGHLQVMVGDQNILLPCEKIGRLLDCDKSTISRYRQMAEKEQYLIVMKPHRSPVTGNGKATEFRFATDRFPELQPPRKPDSASEGRDPRW